MEREPRLRRASAGDAASIAVLQVETWRIAYAHAFPTEYLEGLSVEERLDLWTRTLSGRTFDVFVAEFGGRVAADGSRKHLPGGGVEAIAVRYRKGL